MGRTVRIAAIQPQAHDRAALSQAWPGILRRMQTAADEGAELIVLPEGTLPAYVLGYRPFDEGEIAPALDRCREFARSTQTVVVVGAVRQSGSHIFNSAIVVDRDGSIAGSADKHFLWHFDRQWFSAGERIEPVRTSAGLLGVLVCADGRIPLIARTLVDRGAEILVMPTAWVTSGRDPDNLENVQADLLARVRARENRVPFVAANKCGVELGCVAYCGKSQIVGADGDLLAIAPQAHETHIAAAVEPGVPPERPSISSIPAPAPFAGVRRPVRIAVAAREFEDEALLEERLRTIEAEIAIMPQSTYPAQGTESLAIAFVGDETVLDPAGLAAYRLAGVDVAVWNASSDPLWRVDFARARALELRMYVVVMSGQGRAFAVDPDGAVLCGTFDEYEIAAFTYDPQRVEQTLVAPGTDVRAGLERARDHALH